MEAEEVESREFLISLRGYDRDEVESFLKEVAEEIRRLKEALATAVAPQKEEADRSSIYRQVGEETSKILVAAEDAGRQIRERAQREAAELITDARAEAEGIARRAASDQQAAEEDLRKLRDARALLATQLEDVRRRLDETISRLVAPLEAAPAAPRRAKARKAEAAPAGPPARPEPPAAPLKEAAPERPATAITAPAKVEAPPAPAGPAPSPVEAAPAAARPAPSPVEAAPAPAKAEAAVTEAEPRQPAAASAPAALQLKDLLDEARREREEARREIEDVLARGSVPSEAPAPPAGDAEILLLRDQALGEGPAAAARRLKRLLQEDQNDLLDRIRTSRGKGSFDGDISPAEAQLARFRDGLRESLEGAFLAGRLAAGSGGSGRATPIVGDLIHKQIVSPLRREVGRVVDAGIEAQDTPTSTAERASDVFRVWKGVRTELLGEGLAYSAFHHGMIDAWREQNAATKRWVISSDELDCPKGVCASNAAAKDVPLDGAFPSGHHAPPAHGGCTCALAGV